jgi:alpha-D-ribose 1-methylphosphonate 5-triphosphate synthase subunit PhnG
MLQSQILATCAEEEALRVGALVAQEYGEGAVRLISGPRSGLLMLQLRESVAERRFYAGELLVTEARLELDGEFGFGMVLGANPRRALACALVDAALRRGGALADLLANEIERLGAQLHAEQRRLYQAATATRVEFEIM